MVLMLFVWLLCMYPMGVPWLCDQCMHAAIALMFLTAFSDPGILPRNDPLDVDDRSLLFIKNSVVLSTVSVNPVSLASSLCGHAVTDAYAVFLFFLQFRIMSRMFKCAARQSKSSTATLARFGGLLDAYTAADATTA